MKILEHYALAAGVKIPETPHEFPVNFHPILGDYISLSPKTGQKSKDYDHWPEVVRMISGILQKKGMWIVQIGESSETPIKGCVTKTGLSFRESSFIVQNSKLHLSGDSCFVHFGGAVNTPILALYGSTLPEATGPYFKGRYEALSARKGLPSYLPDEANKEVNNIKPEDVANKALEMLGLPDRIPMETIGFGKAYYLPQMMIIPDFVPEFEKIANNNLVVRMDLKHDENLVGEILRHRKRPITMVTKKYLSLDFLKAAKGGIGQLLQLLDNDFLKNESNFEQVENLKKSGIPYSLVWIGDKDKLGDVRLKLLDFNPVHTKKLEKVEGVTAKTSFVSRQVILGRGKPYASIWHYRRGIEGLMGEVGQALQDDEFWESGDSLYFFKRI